VRAGFCLRERDHFEDLGVGGSVMMDLPNEDCIWLGIRTSGSHAHCSDLVVNLRVL